MPAKVPWQRVPLYTSTVCTYSSDCGAGGHLWWLWLLFAYILLLSWVLPVGSKKGTWSMPLGYKHLLVFGFEVR